MIHIDSSSAEFLQQQPTSRIASYDARFVEAALAKGFARYPLEADGA